MGYTCLRSFNNDAGPSMFCKFEDDESFEEFYNLESDPFQLENLVPLTDEETLIERRLALAELSSCIGLLAMDRLEMLSKRSPRVFNIAVRPLVLCNVI